MNLKKKLGSVFPFRVLVWTEFKFEVGSKTSILNKKLQKKKENERMKTKDENKAVSSFNRKLERKL